MQLLRERWGPKWVANELASQGKFIEQDHELSAKSSCSYKPGQNCGHPIRL